MNKISETERFFTVVNGALSAASTVLGLLLLLALAIVAAVAFMIFFGINPG